MFELLRWGLSSEASMTDKLVLVVHGVGDPMPGDALGSFADGLIAAAGYRESELRSVAHLPSPTAEPRDWRAATFKVAHATLTCGNGAHRLFLREVYWGDLSRVNGSVADLAIAGVDLVFGLRHIAHAAAVQAHHASMGRRWVGKLVSLADLSCRTALHLSRGPMFALNILVAVVCLLFLSIRTLPMGSGLDSLQPIQWAALLGAAGVCAAAWLLRKRFVKTGEWSTLTLNWMIAAGIVTALWVLFDIQTEHPIDSTRPRTAWPAFKDVDYFVEPATSAMSLVAVLMAVATAAAVLFCGLAWLFAGKPQAEKKLALRRAVEVMSVSTVASNMLFTFVAMTGWTLAMKAMNEGTLPNRIANGLHLFVVVWLGLLCLMAVFLCIAAVNEWANRCNSPCERSRYLIHPFISVVMQLVALVWIVLFVALAFHIECTPALSARPGWPDGLCAAGSFMMGFGQTAQSLDSPWLLDIAIALTVAFAASVWTFRLHLGTAIDLVLDVLSHFRIADDAVVRATKPTQWMSMVARFQAVLQAGHDVVPWASVCVVSHSQGTMVAIDALGLFSERSPHTPLAAALRKTKIDLVTMGSPAQYLYEHYFPRCYGIKSKGAAPANIASWLNIYRRDDFIGTRIGAINGAFPQNVSIDPRGHTEYWSDKDVLAQLAPLLQ
jgi:hypothetical protein